MNLLWDMTWRGSSVFLLVAVLDWFFGNRLLASERRLWWCLVPLAFLFPLRIPLAFGPDSPLTALTFSGFSTGSGENSATLEEPSVLSSAEPFPWLAGIWLAGTILSLLLVFIQTIRISRHWSAKRLCTDPSLLNLLEDCKQALRVTAPVGLVLADEVATPAILGWLRPKILLPRQLVSTLPSNQLRSILLHELSHFRRGDVPFNWLMTLVRSLHWFNPLAHLATREWIKFREEAADEESLEALPSSLHRDYGEALLLSVKWSGGGSVPFGSMAIVESMQHLKKRILKIAHYSPKNRQTGPVCLALIVLVGMIFLQPGTASSDDKTSDAVLAMKTWLKGIDEEGYAASWPLAAVSFRKAVTQEQWVAALQATRKPLGPCQSRKLVSSFFQQDIPLGNGQMARGNYVIAQFDSSFSNLKYAVETVTFEKEADGTWRASGYFVKPGTGK